MSSCLVGKTQSLGRIINLSDEDNISLPNIRNVKFQVVTYLCSYSMDEKFVLNVYPMPFSGILAHL